MARSAPTKEDVFAGGLRESGHLNYGPNGFGYTYRHTTIPRLSCIDRYYKGDALMKSGKSTARIWQVDGVEVADLEAALERLASPPVLSLGEFLVLQKVSFEPDWLRAVQSRISGIAEEDAPVCLNDHPRYHGVFYAITRLRDLGLIRLEPRPVERKGDFGPRTMPTIRRVNEEA
jgi:hypothetical protein